MKTIEVKIYQYSELPTDKAKEQAIDWFRELIEVDEWSECTIEDAKTIGLSIDEFDVYHQSIKGKLLYSAYVVAGKIIREHGETCETYKTAIQYRKEWDKLVEKYSDGKITNVVAEDNEYDFDQEADELEEEFKKRTFGGIFVYASQRL